MNPGPMPSNRPRALLAAARERAQALYEAGAVAQAEELCRQIVRADPEDCATRYLLGLACQAQGKHTEAADAYARVLRRQPGHAGAHHQRGLVLAAQGRPREAAACFEKAVRLEPARAEIHHNLGVALAEQHQLREAAACFREALRLRPEYADAHLNLAGALEALDDLAGAETHFREFLRLRPEHHDARNRLGILLARLGRQREAIPLFEEVLRLDPRQARAHNNLGAAFSELGRTDEALRHFEVAIDLVPEYAEARKSRAMIRLLRGDFVRGWEEFEWRWKCQDFTPRACTQPPWDGTPLAGKTILLWAEQGIGDTFQFIRYASLVKERGGRVLAEAPRTLLPLLRSCPGVDDWVAAGDPVPPFDVHLPLLSLPRVFGTTLDSVPVSVPYLTPNPEFVERWRREWSGVAGFKVGLVWQGNPKNAADARRSLPLVQF